MFIKRTFDKSTVRSHLEQNVGWKIDVVVNMFDIVLELGVSSVLRMCREKNENEKLLEHVKTAVAIFNGLTGEWVLKMVGGFSVRVATDAIITVHDRLQINRNTIENKVICLIYGD